MFSAKPPVANFNAYFPSSPSIPKTTHPNSTKSPAQRRNCIAMNIGRSATIVLSFALLIGAHHSAFAAGRVFYDGFESGNTNLWSADSTRNRCQVVSSASDGIAGAYAGKNMARCNWNGAVDWSNAAAYESLVASIPYTNEFLLRLRLRPDQNLEKTGGSPTKIMRFFNWTGSQSTYLDMYGVLLGSSIKNEGVAGGAQLATYWGGKDNAANPASWHKVEYYVNQSTGTIKVWHDGILVRNDSGLKFNGVKWTPLYLTSNWSDSHDATNYLYFDEVEIFSDAGTGAGGSLADASASASGSAGISGATSLRITATNP